MIPDLATGPRQGLDEPLAMQLLDEALRSAQFILVRRRVFRQLIESLIYEEIVRPHSVTHGAELSFRFAGQADDGSPVQYRCRGRRCFSFDRIRLAEQPVERVLGDVVAEASSPSQFLVEIQALHGADPERLRHFCHELEQTLLKDVLAQHARQRDLRPLRDAGYDEIESRLPDGHPYHPSYKSRLGFDYQDNLAYGPEFYQELRPIWLAAHRDWTHAMSVPELEIQAFLCQELGAPAYDQFCALLRRRGYRPEDYLFLPVHPWQWREQIATALFADLHAGHLVLLGHGPDGYAAQQSIRTLANRTSPSKAYVKHAISIVNTSTSRILAPHTVQNAPLISAWLDGLVREDPFLRDELGVVILREVLGLAYDRPGPAGATTAYGALSCIWRESLHQHLAPGEQAAPWSALPHVDADGRPFVAAWVERHGLERWLRRLLEVSVVPLLHLLCAHGLALEAHAQNMILIHRDGWPERVALKDFHDGVRFMTEHLSAPERKPQLRQTPERHWGVNRNSYIESRSVEDVRDFLLDAFFFINLGELALFLSAELQLAEERFWAMVHEVVAAYQQRFPQLHARFQLFDATTPAITVERLTNRRLFPETDVQVHQVRNPLARLAAQQGGERMPTHATDR